MFDEILKYRDELKKASEELEKAGYTVSIRSNGKSVMRIGKVKNRSYFGMLGSVEVLDTKQVLIFAKKLRA